MFRLVTDIKDGLIEKAEGEVLNLGSSDLSNGGSCKEIGMAEK